MNVLRSVSTSGREHIALLLLVGAAGCATATGSDQPSTTVPTSIAAALPGESQSAASRRLLDACMAGFGETALSVGVVIEDGVELEVKGYNTENQATKQHLDECTVQVGAALPIASLSDDDLRTLHSRFVQVLDCLRAEGIDVGVTISLDEFLANGGAPDGLSSRFNQLSDDPVFVERFTKCSDQLPPFTQGG